MTRMSRRVALLAWLLSAATGCGTDLEPPVVATVTVTPGAATLAFLGESAAFTATVTDQYGNPFAGTVAWTSDAPNVFTVSPAGVATAVSNGAGTIRAQVDGVSGTATVTVSQKPTAVERVAGDAQRGRTGTPLVEPLVARILDVGGSPVAGAAVFFSPADGSGFVTPGTAPTDMAGEARASWTLGDDFGPQSLVASVADGPNTVFTAIAQRPNELADSVGVVSGNGQMARPGQGLRSPIVVRVLDEHGAPVEGATVRFETPLGHGLADPDSTDSDGRGEAATTWTLGEKVGVQLLTASVPGGPSARVVATGNFGVCDRTPQVLDALVSAAGVNSCAEVTSAALSQIGELDLTEMGIARLTEDDFAGLTGLETLWLVRNRLTDLPTGVFAELSRLKNLSLEGNELEPSVGLFAQLSRLEFLDLDGNHLQDLPPGLFVGLSNLKHLSLLFNRLTNLRPGTFAALSSLEWLDLAGNQLSPRPNLFAELSNLHRLSLGENRMTDLQPGAFAGLSSLEILGLGENRLTGLRSGAFAGLSSLRYLDLWGNQVELRPGMFTDLATLEHLDLYLNQLTVLPPGAFVGLSSLAVLDLGGNLLNLQPGAFAELPNLEYLKLYENQLSSLPSGVFAGLSSLERLDLGLAGGSIPGGNALKELPPGLFAGLDWLRAVWLNGNPGSPFPLVLRMERTDTTDLAAPGPAKVVVAVETGAPFDIRVRLSAPGGTVSPTWATIRTGGTHSNIVTVTANTGSGSVTVTLDDVPTVPQTHCDFGRRFAQGRGHWGGRIDCYKGIAMKGGDPLRLFR